MNPDALIFFGRATYEQIYYAQKWWFLAGIVGVAFLVIIGYIGWWHQRSLRHHFHLLVSKLDFVDELNPLEGERDN